MDEELDDLAEQVRAARAARTDHKLVSQRCGCGGCCANCASGAKSADDSLLSALVALDEAQDHSERGLDARGPGAI